MLLDDVISLHPSSECIDWPGVRDKDGYGFAWDEGRQHHAHRAVWVRLRGPIPHGLTIDHLCRRPSCVNVDHLEVVTMRENLRRAPSQVSTINAAKTHCPSNHVYDAANTLHVGGRRQCRVCNRERSRRRKAALRAASA